MGRLHKEAVLVRKIIILFSLLLMTAACFAQVPTSGNVFFGYSYYRGGLGTAPTASLNGWEGSVEGKVFPHVGLVADVSGHYGHVFTSLVDVPSNLHSYMFGPRFSFSIGRVRPFAHALIGVGHVYQHSTSPDWGTPQTYTATHIADAIGGGIDYRLIPRLAWRVQADDLQTRLRGGWQDEARISTGLVARF